MPYVGNPLANAFSSRVKQDLTGQSGTSFTLTHAVSSANDLSVYINHVRQEPTTAYSVNGTTLTTTGSVAGTDDFYIIYDELGLQSIAHDSAQAMKATSGTFTGAITATGVTSSGAVSGTTGTFSGAVAGTTGTFSGAVTANSTLDMNGTELILDADGDTSITSDTDDEIDFKTAGTDRFLIDSSGFLRQRFTSDNSTTAEGFFINNMQNSTGNNASLIFSNDSGGRKKAAIAHIDTGNYGAGDLVFALDGADSGALHLTNDEKMRIASSGNVGIGTTNPGTKLQIVNDTDTDYNISTATTNAVLNLKNNTAGANNSVGMSFSTESNGEWYLTAVQETSSECAFHIGARAYGSRHDRMKINSDGTVLIGNKDSNPTAWGLRVFNVHGTHATIEGWNDNSGGKNLNLFRHDDASIFQVSNGGAVWAAGGYSSDKAFKNIIGDCTEGWSKLKDVQPKSYRHKRISNVEQEDGTTKEVFSDDDMDSNIHYGVIAQDLKKVLPDITYGEEGKMSVDYHGLLMVAINTIKELETRITTLENK